MASLWNLASKNIMELMAGLAKLFVCLGKSFFSTLIIKIKLVFINTLNVNPIVVASMDLFQSSVPSKTLMADSESVRTESLWKPRKRLNLVFVSIFEISNYYFLSVPQNGFHKWFPLGKPGCIVRISSRSYFEE